MRKKHTKVLPDSPWSAFQYPIFKMLWIASFVSSIGTWMQDVGAAWLMVTLTTEPIMVASIQAITSFSIFLLALPAGAIADIIDRRRYLILSQTGLMITAGLLALITFLDKISPELLLLLTFCLGSGAALSVPAWFTLMSELVPDKHMTSAVALTSVSLNFSRALGPVLAGFVIVVSGPAAVFALNSLSFFAIIIVLLRWERSAKENALPAERVYGAMRAGLRYVRGSPALQTLLIKSCAFFIFASGLWALLPLVARTQLQCGPIGYGILLALLGFGAVIGAFFLPKLRQNINCDQFIFGGAIGFAFATFILAFFKNFYFASGAMILGGMAWITVLTTFTTLVQQVVSPWVRARALSIFLAIFFGGMSLGSLVWGWIATHYTFSTALSVAAIGLLACNFLTYIFVSGKKLLLNQNSSHPLPLPIAIEEPRYEEGPIMVTIEYSVERKNVEKFSQAIRDLRRIRLRDGAFFWSLFKDIENPQKFTECFMIESWLEHLRQHERLSIADWEVQNIVLSFHQGEFPPHVTHLVAHKLPRKTRK
jgi:MFS family permease